MDAIVKPKLIVVCGPTGIGKTSFSLVLAKEFNGCIVSADSMQIYRHMDIGTAKPSTDERLVVSHFMIDVVDPDEPFDAAMYATGAQQSIDLIHKRGMIPFVVGGTGFYIKALLHGLCRAKPADPVVRGNLKDEVYHFGRQHVYERLRQCDPEAAARIHPNDIYRIIRALEIYEVTGIPMSEYQKRHGFMEKPFDTLKICLSMDRAALYDRINQRVDRMIAEGLLDEVKGLLKKGYTADLRPMQAIGYRHMVDYINGRATWENTVETLKRDTRRYAKRQLSWFKKDPDVVWEPTGAVDEIRSLIRRFLATPH